MITVQSSAKGFRLSVNTERSIDTSLTSECGIPQTVCRISSLADKREIKLTVRSSRLVSEQNVSIGSAETVHVPVCLPPLDSSDPIVSDITVEASSNGETASVVFTATLLPEGFLDIQSEQRSNIIASKILTDYDEVQYFIENNEAMSEQQTGNMSGIQDVLRIMNTVLRSLEGISRDSGGSGPIVRFCSPAEVLQNGSGNMFELSSLFASIMNKMGFNIILIALDNECIICTEISETQSREVKDYMCHLRCNDHILKKDGSGSAGTLSDSLYVIPLCISGTDLFDSILFGKSEIESNRMGSNDWKNQCNLEFKKKILTARPL